jgi:large subunit ribosomal protein L22
VDKMTVETKQFRAKHRFARISARKARLVADIVRGKPVNRALEVLRFNSKRAAGMFDKVIRSAMANAGQDADVDVNSLFIREVRVDGGPLAQGRMRYRIQSRQGVVKIHRRTCHIQVILAETKAKAATETARPGRRGTRPEPAAEPAPKVPPAQGAPSTEKAEATQRAAKKSEAKRPTKEKPKAKKEGASE